MKTSQRNTSILPFGVLILFAFMLFVSCSDSEPVGDSGNMDSQEDTGGNSDEQGSDGNSNGSSCIEPADFVFNEQNGLVNVEFESAEFSEDWTLNTDEPDFTGDGSMVWNGSQNLNQPGVGRTTFKININTPGIYRFVWRSAVTIGNDGTEHNDTWLRFDDADDFFGQNGSSIVYPRDRGKTPNPNGSSEDGWFKIYRSGSDLGFKWQARTSDNNAHDIYVTFEDAGIYTMEISARSSGHAIDRFVLFTDAYSLNEATDETNALSEISCDN